MNGQVSPAPPASDVTSKAILFAPFGLARSFLTRLDQIVAWIVNQDRWWLDTDVTLSSKLG